MFIGKYELNLNLTLFFSAINLQSLIICFALAGINAGAFIPCKLCKPPNKIGL